MLYKSFGLKLSCIFTWALLIFIVFYFTNMPQIINPRVTSVIIFLSILLLSALFVYGSLIIKEFTDTYFLFPQALIFAFVARAVPHLRLSSPPLHDPYYHFICTLNILEYATLEPVLDWWYYLIGRQLYWPDMHLLTTTLVHVTDISVMQLFRFQEPLIGTIFFLAMFILANAITRNYGVAMLSALFASFSDIIIFYQSEYHPQGFSVLFIILMLYTFVRSRLTNVYFFSYQCMAFIFAIIFILSHHFTTLFFSGIFILYFVILCITKLLICLRLMPFNSVGSIKYDVFAIIISLLILIHYILDPMSTIGSFMYLASFDPDLQTHSPLSALILSLFSLSLLPFVLFLTVLICSIIYPTWIFKVQNYIYKIIISNKFEQVALSLLCIAPIIIIISIIIIQTNVPLLTSCLRGLKWGLFILSIISVFSVIRTRNSNEFRLTVLGSCIVFSGVIIAYRLESAPLPLDRIIGFYVPFASILASLTLFRFNEVWFTRTSKNKKMIWTILFSAFILTAGVLNSQTPAYFFEDSRQDTYYWYYNRLPHMYEYKIAGVWIDLHTAINSRYGVEFDTLTTPIFYGMRATTKMRLGSEMYNSDYIIVNPNTPHEINRHKHMSSDQDLSKIYTSKEISIYKSRP